MRPHATLRPRLTSNTSHTPPPSPSRFHSLTPASHLLAQPTRTSNHWRRRRGKKATAEAEQATVFAAVGGARRSGAASPEPVRVEGNARFISRNPSLHFSPFPPCSIPRSIPRDSSDSAVRRRRSCVLAVFWWDWAVSSPPLGRHRRCGYACSEARTSLAYGFGSCPPGCFDAHWFEIWVCSQFVREF